jgi:predicted DNA-binding transcriptional regulator AlpA
MAPQATLFLAEPDAARVVRLSPRTLRRFRVSGDGPSYIRAGKKRVLYDAGEIERWAAERTFPHRAAEIARHTS